jgi:DNA-binding transcriptional ArsR family regulator
MEKQLAISALAALAQETRLDVFRLLVRAGHEGLPAGAIAESLEIPAATLSFHLKELRSAGLVLCEREGRSRIYSPDFSAVGALMAFLTANCCSGVGTDCSSTASP